MKKYKKRNGEILELTNEEYRNMVGNAELTLVVEKETGKESIEQMTKDELLDFATENGIDVHYKDSKQELKNKIKNFKGDDS